MCVFEKALVLPYICFGYVIKRTLTMEVQIIYEMYYYYIIILVGI